jgi:hypothetical protein
MKHTIMGLNLGVAGLVLWLHLSGLITGVTRMGFAPDDPYLPPAWLSRWNGVLFASTGTVAMVFFVALLWRLSPVAFRYWWVTEERV